MVGGTKAGSCEQRLGMDLFSILYSTPTFRGACLICWMCGAAGWVEYSLSHHVVMRPHLPLINEE
jgi:hypothetical protein